MLTQGCLLRLAYEVGKRKDAVKPHQGMLFQFLDALVQQGRGLASQFHEVSGMEGHALVVRSCQITRER